MTDFLSETKEENIREVFFDLDNLPYSLIYKLEEVEFTFSAVRFGMDWKEMDYYHNRMPAGLIEQFPCLSYMLEDYWREATSRTPLEEIEYRKAEKLYFENENEDLMCLSEDEILLDGRQLRNNNKK